MAYKEIFDPDGISNQDMERLANSIETYLMMLEEVMVIPKSIRSKCENDIKNGIKITKKLVKKLRNHDRSVFKNKNEWDNYDLI